MDEMTIGCLTFFPNENKIQCGGSELKVTPQVMSLVEILGRSVNQVVLRNELVAELWPETVVGDESLTRLVSDLRKALRALNAESSVSVKTVAKRGYKLVVVEEGQPEANKQKTPHIQPSEKAVPYFNSIKLGAIVLVIFGICFAALYSQRDTQPPAILVLPFDNLTGDPDVDLLSDGLVEDVVTALTDYPEVAVAAKTSSFYFKANPHSLEDISGKLNVDYVLEGAVSGENADLQISYRLVNARTGFAAWSKIRSISSSEWRAVNQELLEQLAVSFDFNVASRNPSKLISEEAYRLFLKANRLSEQSYSVETLRDAAELYERAELLAPKEPQLLLASAVNYLELMTLVESESREAMYASASEKIAKAKKFGAPRKTVLFLEGMRLSPHPSNVVNSDINQALSLFSQAHALGEKSYDFYFTYAYFLSTQKQYEKAKTITQEGISYHPLAFRLHGAMTAINLLTLNTEGAALSVEQMRKLNPDSAVTDWMASLVYAMKGEYQEAFKASQLEREKSPSFRSLMRDSFVAIAANRGDLLNSIISACENMAFEATQCELLNTIKGIYSKQEYTPDISELIPESSVFLQAVAANIPEHTGPESKTRINDALTSVVGSAGFYYRDNWNLLFENALLGAYQSDKEKVLSENVISVYFEAELLALEGKTERCLEKLDEIVDQMPVIPIGRAYAFFESPFFASMRDIPEFHEKKRVFEKNLEERYSVLTWEP